jgi:phosphoribosylformimino-5-aminoimidazole carboxamide ribotide isomerase
VIVIPAIDVRGGRAVRLVRGRPRDETVYDQDPVAVAGRFAASGASWLHVVDLDAAFGEGHNREAIRQLVVSCGVPVQVGGGLRSMGAIEEALAAGAARVVVGTAAVDPAFVREAVGRFGDRIVVALDVDDELVRVRGWTAEGGRIDQLLPVLDEAGAPRFLVTAVGRDGTLEGPDLSLYERLSALTERPILASGGVRTADDLRALAATGVEGAVVGKALYEGALELAEALEAVT